MPAPPRPERRTTTGTICCRRNRPAPAVASTAKKVFGSTIFFRPKTKGFTVIDAARALAFEDGKALVEAAARITRIRQGDINAIFVPNEKSKRRFVVVASGSNYIKLEGTDAKSLIDKEKKLRDFLHSIGSYH